MKFIFKIKIKEGHTEQEYIDVWKRGSAVIQKMEGAQGTALHRKIGELGTLLAIATWESKEARDAAMKKLQEVDPETRRIIDAHKEYGETDSKMLGNFEEIERVNPH